MTERALVRNAADEGQVKEAARKERFNRKEQLDDMRAVLTFPAGRRVLWRLLEHCRVFESIYHNSAMIHYNAGAQDVGHFLLGEITSADQAALVLMMQEHHKESDDDDSDRTG